MPSTGSSDGIIAVGIGCVSTRDTPTIPNTTRTTNTVPIGGSYDVICSPFGTVPKLDNDGRVSLWRWSGIPSECAKMCCAWSCACGTAKCHRGVRISFVRSYVYKHEYEELVCGCDWNVSDKRQRQRWRRCCVHKPKQRSRCNVNARGCSPQVAVIAVAMEVVRQGRGGYRKYYTLVEHYAIV